jgi:hypothetical protein
MFFMLNKLEQNVSVIKTKGINFSIEGRDTNRIKELRKRVCRCCCKYCGERLELRRLSYNTYDYDDVRIEIFCSNCNRIEYGVEPEIYIVSQYYVNELGFDNYPDLDEGIRKMRMNIAMVNDIISWAFKNMGLLSPDGINVPIRLSKEELGEVTILTEKTVREMAEKFNE